MNEQVIKEAIASIRETADTAIRSIQELTYDTYKVGEVEMKRNSEDRMECVWGNDIFKGMGKLPKDTIYDWGSDLVTKEVRWIARDSSGAVYGYIDECPTLSSEEWDPEGFYNYNIGQTVIKKEVPWRESLEKRPE